MLYQIAIREGDGALLLRDSMAAVEDDLTPGFLWIKGSDYLIPVLIEEVLKFGYWEEAFPLPFDLELPVRPSSIPNPTS